MIFIGYPEGHSSSSYRFYNEKTRGICISRDIHWLNKNYKMWKNNKDIYNEIHIPMSFLNLDNVNNDDSNDNKGKTTINSRSSSSSLKGSSGGIDTRNIINSRLRSDKMKTRSMDSINHTLVSLNIKNKHPYEDPKNYNSYWNHPNSSERVNWRLAIQDEINTMVEKNVFEIVDKKDKPSNQNPILTKWVFKKKNNFKYRERLVAFGFQQIQGIDYFDSHSPVIHDICTRMIMMMSMKNNVKLVLIDITKAFLESKLKEDIYIEVPKGYSDVLKA